MMYCLATNAEATAMVFISGGAIVVGIAGMVFYRWEQQAREKRIQEAQRALYSLPPTPPALPSDTFVENGAVIPCCPKCGSPRVAEARTVSIGGKDIQDARWINVHPLASAMGRTVDLTCMACGAEYAGTILRA